MAQLITMLLLLGAFGTLGIFGCSALNAATPSDASQAVKLQWGVKIPLRDGIKLNATMYRPSGPQEPAPCVLTLTPYIAAIVDGAT